MVVFPRKFFFMSRINSSCGPRPGPMVQSRPRSHTGPGPIMGPGATLSPNPWARPRPGPKMGPGPTPGPNPWARPLAQSGQVLFIIFLFYQNGVGGL